MTAFNRKLGIATAVLFVLALFTYHHSTSRAERFETGQTFLQNLNPDEIAGIEIHVGGAGSEESVTLSRVGERFVLAERNGYRAKNEEINRVVRDLLNASLDRRMGAGEDLESELGLTGDEAVSVVLENASGEEMVSLRLGSTADDGGRYVQRIDGEDQSIYRTEAALSVATDPSTFLDKEIVDHPSSSVVRIDGPGYVLAREQAEDGTWQGGLALESGDTDEPEANRLGGFLSRLAFDEVLVADDPAVAGLRFDRRFTFRLDDLSGYRIEVAEDGDQVYARFEGFLEVDRVEVSAEESDEELEEKADVLRRNDEIIQFNQFHGSWVYRLRDFDAEKLELTASDLRS